MTSAAVGVYEPIVIIRDHLAEATAAAGHQPVIANDRQCAADAFAAADAASAIVGIRSHDDEHVLHRLRASRPEMPVLALVTALVPNLLDRLLDSGAAGVLDGTASTAAIMTALAAVLSGCRVTPSAPCAARVQPAIAPQQRRWLSLLADGARTSDVAADTGYSERHMQRHLRHLYRDLGANDRTSAIAEAIRRQLI